MTKICTHLKLIQAVTPSSTERSLSLALSIYIILGT